MQLSATPRKRRGSRRRSEPYTSRSGHSPRLPPTASPCEDGRNRDDPPKSAEIIHLTMLAKQAGVFHGFLPIPSFCCSYTVLGRLLSLATPTASPLEGRVF